MQKNNWKNFPNSLLSMAKKVRLKSFLKKQIFAPFKNFVETIGAWKFVGGIVFAIFFLYYPIGAMRINDIETNIFIEITPEDPQASSSIETASYIIDKEINKNFWTPNLPFFFPSYLLDNMPNFQLGELSSLASFTSSLAKRIDKQPSENSKSSLIKAGKLLHYSGKIWIFSPELPSANSQYRKARHILIKYNDALKEGSKIFLKNPEDLAAILSCLNKDIIKATEALEIHVREESSSFFDLKSDDVFYYNKGRFYADYLFLKALVHDYKDIIVAKNLYPEYIQALKALEQGSIIDPSIIRNGAVDSSFAPNHLLSMAFYGSKASVSLQKVINNLNAN